MPNDTLKELIGTLEQSVSEILTKGTPEERDALLKRSFEEFTAAMDGEMEKLAPAEEEEALFKGMGCVGRVAKLVADVAGHIEEIKTGHDRYGIGAPGMAGFANDPASEGVSMWLDSALRACELALRTAVNECVEVHDDGDDVPEGFRLVTVPVAEAPDSDDMAVVVKTDLPEELAKFATDPAILAQMAIDESVDVLVGMGFSPRRLEKALGIEGLAKAAGAEDDDEDQDEMEPDGDEGMGGPGDGDGDEAMDEDEAADSPLDVLGRLLAGAMIQLASIQQMVEGQGQGEDEGDAGGMPPAEAEEAGEEPEDDEGKVARKSDAAGDLAKGAVADPRVEQLEKMVAGLTADLKRLAGQPAPAKGATMNVVGVTKQADGLAKADDATFDPKDQKWADGYSENDLQKMDPEARALIAIKRAQSGVRAPA